MNEETLNPAGARLTSGTSLPSHSVIISGSFFQYMYEKSRYSHPSSLSRIKFPPFLELILLSVSRVSLVLFVSLSFSVCVGKVTINSRLSVF